MACTDIKIEMEKELTKIVGLDALKTQLRKWFKGMILDQRRRGMGITVGPRRLPQLAFLGNPGTGKTMVARMLSKLLHRAGVLSKDKVIEVQRTDLVAKYIGQTGPQTRKKIEEAEGGILFVDEAYRLVHVGGSSNDFGLEAIEEIMSFMDSGKIVVIFAGYTKPMEHLISSNEGIRRRISNIFHFDDLSCEQLAQVVHIKLPSNDKNSPFYGFKLDPKSTSVKEVAELIERETTAAHRGKMNGGLVDQMLVKARENLDSRIDVECTDKNSIVAITKGDLTVGLRLLTAEEESENKQQMVEELAELGKQKMSCTDIKIEMEKELTKIVGLDALKTQLRKWFKGMILDQRRRDIGLTVGPRRLPQLAFLGNPGTGKTMVARLLSKLLHKAGILSKNKVIEVQRTDLVAEYIGQTGPRTRKKIKEAEGGILFVDEAYRLVPECRTYKDFGLEAVEEIMSFMDSGKIVVIFAGYTKPMEHLISSNEGIRRRISNIFHFDDLSCEQLAQVVHIKLPNNDENSPFYGFKLDPRSTSVKEVAELIERETTAAHRGKMNGGLVDQMLVKARENLDSRIDTECADEYSIVAITKGDLTVGLRLLTAEEESENKQQMVKKDEKEAPGSNNKELEMVIRAGLEKEMEALKARAVVMANLGYLQGAIDSARCVKENLPGTNLDFLRRNFDEYITNFPPAGGANLYMFPSLVPQFPTSNQTASSLVLQFPTCNQTASSLVPQFPTSNQTASELAMAVGMEYLS